MGTRIDSIHYFDYTHRVGRSESLRNFASLEMTYSGIALSTPDVQVNAKPNKFKLSAIETNRIREYLILRMPKLEETSKLLAENSPQYICIHYFDGSEKFYKYNEAFCQAFQLAWKLRPKEQDKPTEESNLHFAQKQDADNAKQQQTVSLQSAHVPPSACTQQNIRIALTQTSNNTNQKPGKNKKSFQIVAKPASMLFLVSTIILMLEDLSFLSSPLGLLGWLISLLVYQLVAQLLAYLSGYVFLKRERIKLVWINYTAWTLILNLGRFLTLLGI